MMNTYSFNGFSPEALRFLRDLVKHNDRQWFAPRKHIYETELLEPLRALVADASAAMRKAKIPLGGDPRHATFRIYRDIRFSSDKSPYKTNVAAYLARERHHDLPGGLYIHIQPKNSFIVAGFYQMEKMLLQRWRETMATEPKRFEAVLRALERNDLLISEEHEALKRMPRGFESYIDLPIARYFLLKSMMVSRKLSDDDLGDRSLVARMVDFAKAAKPLLEYGWRLNVSEEQ